MNTSSIIKLLTFFFILLLLVSLISVHSILPSLHQPDDHLASLPEALQHTSQKAPRHREKPHKRIDPLFPAHLKSVHEPTVKETVESMRTIYPTVDPLTCPSFPDHDYPKGYPVLDVTKNWPPDAPR